MEEKLLTIRDVSQILSVSEKEVMDLAEKEVIPAYKIGGVYLRFKSHQVMDYKKNLRRGTQHLPELEVYGRSEKVRDFLYFNDFYILAGLLVALILVVIFRGY